MKKFLNRLKLTLKILTYSLFVFTPFAVNSRTSEIFEFNKMIVVYLISSLTLAFFLPVFFVQREYYIEKIKRAKVLFIFLFVFNLALFISFLFSIDKYVSFYGYYGRFNGGVLSFLAYSWIAILVYFIFEERDFENILLVSFWVSLFIAFEAILSKYNFDFLCFLFSKSFANTCWTEFFKPSERIFGFLGQPNWLATYLGVNLMIANYFAIRKRKNWLYIAGFALFLLGILFTRSFSGIIATIIAFVSFNFFVLFLNRKKLKIAINLFLIFIILFSLLGYGKFVRKRSLNAINWIKQYVFKDKKATQNKNQKQKALAYTYRITDSFKIRLIVWKGALKLWRKYPFFGTGPETFGIAYYFTRPLEHNFTSEWDYLYNKAHNEFLNFLATSGLIGFLSYFILIGYFVFLSFYQGIKSKDFKYWLIFSVFLVLHITDFAGFSTVVSNLYLFFFMGIVLILQGKKIKANEKKYDEKLLPALAVSLVLVIIFLVFLGRMYLADLSYAKGKLYENLNDYYNATVNYNRALKLFYNPVYAEKLSFSTANLYYLYKLYVKEKNVNPQNLQRLAIFFINKALNDSPYNLIFLKTKAKIFFLFYQADLKEEYLDAAISALEKACKIAPTEPRVHYLYTYLKFFKWKDSKEKLKMILKSDIAKLIRLKPDYPQSHVLKAKVLLFIEGKKSALNYLKGISTHIKNFPLKDAIEKLEQI